MLPLLFFLACQRQEPELSLINKPNPVSSQRWMMTPEHITASDGEIDDLFSISLAMTGDINDDGFPDMVIGASEDDDNGMNAGAAYVYYGSAQGIDPTREDKLLASDGDSHDDFGGAVAEAGDVDGDGFIDILVGAYADEEIDAYSGAVYLYYGGSGGIDTLRELKIMASDGGWNHYFGAAASSAGDINNDGYADILVTATGAAGGDGAAYVYYGSALGLNLASEQKIVASDSHYQDNFGAAPTSLGDLDQDGYDDILLSAVWNDENGTNAGAVYIYYGSALGIDTSREEKLMASDGTAYDNFGSHAAELGDVDGDGCLDFVVGVPSDKKDTGSVYAYYGSCAGIDRTREDKIMASNGEEGDEFGRVAPAGDVDQDGYADLLVGAYYHDGSDTGTGMAYIYYGSPSGIHPHRETQLAPLNLTAYDALGSAVSGGQDLNQDGYVDMLVSAHGDSSGTGMAYLYLNCRGKIGQVEIVGDGVDQNCNGWDALTLTLHPKPSHSSIQWTIEDSAPNTLIAVWAGSAEGAGPCLPNGVCLGILNPILLASMLTNSSGSAQGTHAILPGFPAQQVFFQAVSQETTPQVSNIPNGVIGF